MTISTKRKQLAGLAGQHFGTERDLYTILGYPRVLSPQEYVDVYERQDIAGRIVDAYPDATWRHAPEIRGDESFINAFLQIEKNHKLWRTLHRLDRLMNLGHYGVLLLGLDGAQPMEQPVSGSDYNLLYLQPHSERTAQIIQWEDDPRSVRFGMPKFYNITTGVNWTGTGAGQKTIKVHHSRVLHVAERALEDSCIGTPRLKRVYNRLMDLDKLLGGSAEIFWQNAAMIYAFMADKDVEFEESDKEEMADQLEEMQHGLRRFLRLRGMSVESLAAQVADPSNHIDSELDAIAGACGIPKRILIGSERGELSSEQDENNWAARVSERREQFAGPSIIEAFIARGVELGFLPSGFTALEWTEADTLGEQARAEIADRRATALQKYGSTPGAELIITPEEFRAWLGEEGELPEVIEEPIDEKDEQTVTQFARIK